jgi:alkylation response protein AidB-like acyl-CoA dehydrogenase
MMRLYYGLLLQKTHRLAMELRGVDGLSFDSGDSNWTHRYLHSFKDTISAGTAQIQRNIIGERVLGLPREGREAR